MRKVSIKIDVIRHTIVCFNLYQLYLNCISFDKLIDRIVSIYSVHITVVSIPLQKKNNFYGMKTGRGRDRRGAGSFERHVCERFVRKREGKGREDRFMLDRQAPPCSCHPCREGWLRRRSGKQSRVGGQRGSFNVCLPREAIKINTSNYQAVLNFLGATSPGTLPLCNSPFTTTSLLFSRNSVPSAVDRPTRRISLHSRAFYFQQVLQLRDAEVFLNFKGKNAVLKMQQRRQEPLSLSFSLYSVRFSFLCPPPLPARSS